MTDPIADMLSRIKNALNARSETVDIPHSKIKEEIAKIIVGEGYVGKYAPMEKMDKKFIRIALKYRGDKSGLITGLRRVSKSGRRVYVDRTSLPRVQAGFGTAIISTSRGLMTGKKARSEKIGGEVLCYIW
jgi:small subunit ribosomal protein S8